MLVVVLVLVVVARGAVVEVVVGARVVVEVASGTRLVAAGVSVASVLRSNTAPVVLAAEIGAESTAGDPGTIASEELAHAAATAASASTASRTEGDVTSLSLTVETARRGEGAVRRLRGWRPGPVSLDGWPSTSL